jgi:hypothetical protein
MTVASKIYKDDISPKEKKRRWLVLEKLINKSNNPNPNSNIQ